MHRFFRTFLPVFACALSLMACDPHVSRAEDHGKPAAVQPRVGESVATFAGGCFWCMEPPFEGLPGVRSVMSGYAGGKEKNPDYKDVSYGRTGHTESVQVVFDPKVTSYERLVEIFLRSMDPTDLGGQFADRGKQYRPAIFVRDEGQRKVAEKVKQRVAKSGRFDKPVVVPIVAFTTFYPAENYHQDYYKKNPSHYKQYRRGSGREGFLKRIWGSDLPTKPRAYRRPPESELKDRLTSVQYEVTQQNGTERPFVNTYWNNKQPGIYVDVVSGEPLFSSKDKFKSGTGWPSFTRPLVSDHVVDKVDKTHGMRRVEVRSKYADSHLGHVFEDGPAPTGLRYCINSASLRFVPAAELEQQGYGEFAHLFESSPKTAQK